MKIQSENQFIRLSFAMLLSITLTACVVAPPQPVGYRMTSSVLPTYVNGQYVGMQPSGAVSGDDVSGDYVSSGQASPVMLIPSNVLSPVYVQQPSSVMYVQRPTSAYTYSPYNSSYYVDPWYGVGVGIGTGIGLGIGINYLGGRCCWRGSWRARGWHGGGWRYR